MFPTDTAELLKCIEHIEESTKKLPHTFKSAKARLQNGAIKSARSSISTAIQILGQAADEARDLSQLAAIPWSEYLSRQDYGDQLVQECRGLGLDASYEGGLLFCFPSTVRIVPEEESVIINGSKSSEVAPTVVANQLLIARNEANRKNPKDLLELVFKAYRVLLASADVSNDSARVVPLFDIYNALTLWPENNKRYSRREFAIDLYLIDASGIAVTADGARLTFAASTGSRDRTKIFQAHDHSGSEKVYYGIYFQLADGHDHEER